MAAELSVRPVVASSTVKKKINWYLWGTLFVLPEMVLFIVFLWVPIFKGIFYSFYNIDFVDGNHFIGLANYVSIFQDGLLITSITNTLYYMGLGVLLGFWVPPLIAIVVSELKWFQGAARIIGYLPSAVPAIVLYGMWQWFFDAVGPINSLLQTFGIPKVEFFSPKMAMGSIVLLETWQSFGAATLIYIAAVVGIPRDIYEAAEIDGASVWQRIRHITLPSIKTLMLLLLLLQLITTSQGFQAQLSMTDGGPNNATLTYLLWMNHTAFRDLDFGKASAMGSLMFFVLILLSVLYNLLQRRGEKA
ncbi:MULTISPECIES: carbohydrate ABC transporter permease [unclassified Paenibacillus]|uniref:carbohydrate ABC transporter permease n=1 Tax=unclassified Paenibacillus TaxID=185978 RepID=UPI00070EEE03|nr:MULTISPECIES: sugar ABC transporter permease [unclassified Paenibacillus]KQX62683.1 ABC transporter permease [Paenibacillus sp. Root444D2]KRE46391.1 ABC transporter permease [Paenibacillus sp. Soil724D2]